MSHRSFPAAQSALEAADKETIARFQSRKEVTLQRQAGMCRCCCFCSCFANWNVCDRVTKAKDFEGEGGPEDKQAAYAADNGGNDDVTDNVRQGGETRRP